jgi:CxxC motif-containing protein
MKKRELTCIVCPRGCGLTVELSDEGKVLSVSGNICKRGVTYAENECTNPMRTVTSTVRCKGGAMVAVKTGTAVPKGQMSEVMAAINKAVADDNVQIGDVIIENVCGIVGVDVVATGRPVG